MDKNLNDEIYEDLGDNSDESSVDWQEKQKPVPVVKVEESKEEIVSNDEPMINEPNLSHTNAQEKPNETKSPYFVSEKLYANEQNNQDEQNAPKEAPKPMQKQWVSFEKPQLLFPKSKSERNFTSLVTCITVVAILFFVIATFFEVKSIADGYQKSPLSFEEFLEKYNGNGNDNNGYIDKIPSPSFAPNEGNGLPDGFTQNPNIEVPKNDTGLILNPQPNKAELSPQDVYDKVIVSTVTVQSRIPLGDGSGEYQSAGGTGIIVTSDGYIITNSHVVGDKKTSLVNITDSNGNVMPAVVVAADRGTDLALLKVNGKDFIPAEFANSSELKMGQWVMAIGNPGGEAFSGSITRGIVSGLDREVGYSNEATMKYIQTDAAINPGNSGGPLVNMYGQVVGINTVKIVADYFEGMGFALPTTQAKEIIDQLLSTGYVSGRVRLGITALDLQNGGIEIIAIDKTSSFTGTDVQVGDIITKINGVEVSSVANMSAEFLKYKPGDTVEVELYRNSSPFTAKIVLLEDKGETQK